MDSYTNQLFVILTKEQAEVLGKEYTFEYLQDLADGGFKVVRFCTSGPQQKLKRPADQGYQGIVMFKTLK